MKKVLLATAIAAVSTTAAMADVSISDYQEGKVHALMQTANTFEARGINIVENSNKIAVHKTVNAWNQGWNALEGENTVDLDSVLHTTTLVTTSHGVLTVETSNIEVGADGNATVTTGAGVSYEILSENVQGYYIDTVSLRDSRADLVEMNYGSAIVEYDLEGETVYTLRGSDFGNFDQLATRVEAGIQTAYDSGFSAGYTAGYDDGFAAAKGVVKN